MRPLKTVTSDLSKTFGIRYNKKNGDFIAKKIATFCSFLFFFCNQTTTFYEGTTTPGDQG